MDDPIHSPANISEKAPTEQRLDIISDSICPWCYIGKRHLEAALPALVAEGLIFAIRWRPFQLNPAMPREGRDRRAYRSAKFGSWENSVALDANVTAAGALDGLEFHHERMLKTPNTVASHILIRLAYEIGQAALQGQVVEALFAGYFTQGRDIGDAAVLADIGAEAGIAPEETLAAIRDPAAERAVIDDEGLARRLHVSGVPSLVLNGRYLFSGAQPVPVIQQTLRAVSGQPVSEPMVTAPTTVAHVR